MQLFPEEIRKLWNGWEVRVLIGLSLLIQIILIIFGSRRKSSARIGLRILVWMAYMTADSVATLALGNLANIEGDDEDKTSKQNTNALVAFWAPFLLLHLGGPDNITAYSLEDNELWLRHLLGLIVQVGVAFYVFLRYWSNNALIFLAIPIFVTGIIKYGERTFVLRSSSSKHFRDSLSTVPNQPEERIDPAADHYLVQAHFLFRKTAYFFANMILDYYGPNDPSYSLMHNKSADDAFNLVETELGFMFDVLYTKATIVYSRSGIFLRCISCFSSVSALIVFSIIIDIHGYQKADISLTYLLLAAAVFLEVYAAILFLLSDWTKFWLIKLKTPDRNPKSTIMSHLPQGVSRSSKRWSRSIAQYNLVSSCLKDMSATFIHDLISEVVDLKYQYLTWKSVNSNLQEAILKQIKNTANEVVENFADLIDQGQSWKEILNRRGDFVLQEKYSLNKSQWSTSGVDFDHSLLVWHIATDLCYYYDLKSYKFRENDTDRCYHHEKYIFISKRLSDYMLYLLVFCPSMLSKGISHETKYTSTCNAIKAILEKENDIPTACEVLYHDKRDEQEEEDLSVLHIGRELAKSIQDLESGAQKWIFEKKWEMISEVWIEMLTYAANRCGWKEHGQQLRKGGELLTHVSLLMAHLGLSEQYQMKNLAENIAHKEWPLGPPL